MVICFVWSGDDVCINQAFVISVLLLFLLAILCSAGIQVGTEGGRTCKLFCRGTCFNP